MNVLIDYTNFRGERAVREITPLRIWHGATAWHPEPQWLLDATDVAKGERRTFAIGDIHQPWPPAFREWCRANGGEAFKRWLGAREEAVAP